MVSIVEPNLREYLEDRFSAESIDIDYVVANLAAEIGEVFGGGIDKMFEQNISVINKMNQAVDDARGTRETEDFELLIPDYITNEQFIEAVSDFYRSQGMEFSRHIGNGYVFSREGKRMLVYCTPMEEGKEKSGFLVTVTDM